MEDAYLSLLAIASQQHGAVGAWQARERGLTWDVMNRKVKNGTLLRPYEGVYVVAGSPATWERAVMVAVLSSSPSAVASHATACHIYGLTRRPRKIEISVVGTVRRHRDWIIHRSTDLIPAEVQSVNGIACTSPARTMVDVGNPWGTKFAERCLDEAVRQGLTSDEEVARVVHRVGRKGRNGVGPIRIVLMSRLGWGALTESQIESEVMRILVAAGVRLPEPQVRVFRRDGKAVSRVDFIFREAALVIQLDGFAYHSDRRSFILDRRSQNDLVQQGFRVLRFTAFDVFAAPEYVVAQVIAALAKSARHPCR